MKARSLWRWFAFGASILAAASIWAARPLTAAAACTVTNPCYAIVWFNSPIAPTGSLASGTTTTFSLYVSKDTGGGGGPADCTKCSVSLRIDPASTAPGSATAVTAGMNGVSDPGTPTALTTTGKAVLTSDAALNAPYLPGEIDLTFTTSSPRVVSGIFTIDATIGFTSMDSYTYNTALGKLAFSQTPIAPTGSLGPNQVASALLYTEDSAGNPLAGANVWLSFSQTVSGSAARAGASGTPLTATPAAFTSDSSGSVPTAYVTPLSALPPTGTDTITAQDAPSGASIIVSDSYTYATPLQKLVFAPTPIAANGTLGPGQVRSLTVTAETNNGTPISGASVWLSFSQAAGGGAATVGSAALTTTPAAFNTDTAGHVSIGYGTSATNLPPSGADTITAQDVASSPTVQATDSYTYATQFAFTPNPIASSGTLSANASVSITLTTQLSGGTAVGSAQVWLSFTPTTNGGSAVAGPSGTALTSTPSLYTSDAGGHVSITYHTAASILPASGTDTITAQNAGSNPTLQAPDSYVYASTIGKLVFSPIPIAGSGTLANNQGGPFTVQAETAGGTPISGANVFLSFAQTTGGGSAAVGSTPLTSTPAMFATNASGIIYLTYTTGSASLPASGTDTVTAQDAASNPSVVASDSYTFQTHFAFSPSPIASAGALGTSASVPVTLTTELSSGTAVGSAQVWLSLAQAPGGGSATVGPNTIALTSTPSLFTSDNSGHLGITYHTSSSALPTSGSDTITAQNASSNATVQVTDTYQFMTAVGKLIFSPVPIAPQGSLAVNQSVTITLTAQASDGTPLFDAEVWAWLTGHSGASATANNQAITAAPTSFRTDGSGHLFIFYLTSTTLPSSGIDIITAQNQPTSPTVLSSDSYDYSPAAIVPMRLAFSPTPIAGTGTLAGNESATVTLTTEDGNGAALASATAWLSFNQAPNGGSAMAFNASLSSTPAPVTSDGAGHISVTYHSPGVLPNGGTDTVIAQNLSSNPSATAQDTYTYLPMVAALPAMANQAYGGYITVTYVQNTGNAAANVLIRYFDSGGNRIGHDDVNSSLPVNGSWTVRQDSGNGLPAQTAGSAIVFSDQPLAEFVNEFAPGGGDATSYSGIQLPAGAASTLDAPAIASNAYGGYTTAIGLINLASSPTTITITYRKGDGTIQKTQTLSGVAAGAYLAVYSGNSGSSTDANLPANFAGTATIQSSAGTVAAIVNEVGPGGQFSSYDAVAADAATEAAPTILNNAYGGYNTAIGLQDLAATTANVTISYSGQVGGGTTTQTFQEHLTLAPFGNAGDYNGGGSTNAVLPDGFHGSATIQSDQPLASIVNEVAAPATAGGPTTQSTAYNTFAAGVGAAHLPLVANAGSDGVTTGVGIENISSGTASVMIAYYDATSGALLTQKTVDIAPGSFLGEYTPADLTTAGTRATAVISTSGNALAVIVNEVGTGQFMSYDAQ